MRAFKVSPRHPGWSDNVIVRSTHPHSERAANIHKLIEALHSWPYTPLNLADLDPRRKMLAELREYLPLMGRVLKSDEERRRYQDMLRLWDRENTRVEQAYTQPVAQVSALGALQKNWLRRHSGQPLDMRRSLVLVLEHFEDVVLRITIPAFTVRDGVLLNPTSPYAYSLLLAPAWYAHFLPSCFDGAKIGLADTALTTKVDVDDLKDDAIEAMLSLWCEDMSSDYFQLNQLREAVQDLLALG